VSAPEIKKLYRIEHYITASKKHKYYLVRDINVNGRRTKIRKYIGSDKPSETEFLQLTEKYGEEIENRAIQKEVKISIESYKINYLDHKTVEELETVHFFINGLLNYCQ
jgi:hypothetical protein